jgi:hypothetical protein
MRRKRNLVIGTVIVVGVIIYGVVTAISSSVRLESDFRDGAQGWEAGFAEYSPETVDMMLEAGSRPLPSELGINGTGYYLQGMNHSDDLFMFLKRRLGPDDGVVPGQEYRVMFTIVFASNAPSGAVGIGGSPGGSVYLKAGASVVEPEVYLDSADNHYHMNVDKGEGNEPGGEAASKVGDIANGLSAEEDPRYVSLKRQHEHQDTVNASQDGELWLLVGTDSGFEGLTGIYYESIVVTLVPLK